MILQSDPNLVQTTIMPSTPSSHIYALQLKERLSKIVEINKQELENCLYSRATLNSLSLILPHKTHMNWITKIWVGLQESYWS